MFLYYSARNHYWTVAGDTTRVYSSAAKGYVPAADQTFAAWLAAGGVPTAIDAEASLWDVLRAANVPPYHLVPKRVIVDRLQAAGRLQAALAALNAADIYTQQRWNTRDSIYADDPTANALLKSVNADPAVILAPEQ